MANYYLNNNGTITKKKKEEKKATNYFMSDNGIITKEKQNVSNNKKWIDKGSLDDGYQFGDASKTILGTGVNVASGVLKGVSDIGFGAGKLIAGGVAQVADWVGQDEWADKVRNRIAGKDEKTNERLKAADVFGNINEATQESSILGEKGNEVVKSIGQIAGYGAASTINPSLGTAAMFGSSAGESLGEAYSKENVTNEQAWTKALAAGGISAATERLFGLFGKSGLDTAVANKISSKLTSGMSKELARLGVQATSEATEELLEYAGNQLLDLGIDAASNGKGAKFHEDWNWEEVGQQMATAAIASGIVGAGTKAIGIRNTQGSNLQEKINNYALQEDIQEGLLPPQQENPLEKLQRTNIEQRQQINQQVEQELATRRNGINQELSLPTVSTEGMNLMESASRYNIKPETQSAVQNLMENRGIESRWDATKFNDNSVNALWTKDADGNRQVIFNPNASLDTIVEEVAVHELTHDILSSENTTLNSQEVLNYVKTLQGYNEARQSLENTYATMYDPNSAEFNSLIDEEVVADVLGRKLGNQEFINQLVNSKPSVAKSIYNWVVNKLNSIVNKGKVRSEKLYWQNIKNNFENAYKQEYKNNEMASTKYKASDINTDNQGRTLSKQQQEYFKDSKVRDDEGRLLEVYHGTPNGDFNIFDRNKLGETTLSTDSKLGFHFTENKEFAELYSNGKIGIDRDNFDSIIKKVYLNIKKPFDLRILGDYIENGRVLTQDDIKFIKDFAKIYSDEKLNTIEDIEDYFDNFYDLDTDRIKDALDINKLKKMGYDGVINYIQSNDMGVLQEEEIENYGYEYIAFESNQIKNVDNTNPTSNEDIRYSKENAKWNEFLDKNIAKDNQGNEVAPGMQKYMSDSRARVDEDINKPLVRVYHTMTDMGVQFNEFNPVGTEGYRFGENVVNFYTNSKTMSGSYADYKYKMADTKKLNSINEAKNWLKQQKTILSEYDIKDLGEKGYALTENGQSKRYFKDKLDLLKNIKQTFYEYNKQFGSDKGQAKYQYEGYVNITNPYIVDAKGENWDNILVGYDDLSVRYAQEIGDDIKEQLIEMAKESKKLAQETSEKWWDNNKELGELRLKYVPVDKSIEELKKSKVGTDVEYKKLVDRAIKLKNEIAELEKLPYKYEDSYFKENVVDIMNKLNEEQNMNYNEYELYKMAIKDFVDESLIDTYGNKQTTNEIIKSVLNKNKNGANYDGVIIKNVMDYGSTTEFDDTGAAQDVYVTFNSNQFKAADNTTPTSDPDIRYSKQSEEWDKWNNKTIEPEGTKTKLGNIKLPTRQKVSLPTKSTTEAKTSSTEPKKPISKSTLTQAETKELNDLKTIDEAIGLDSEEEARMKFLEKKQQGYVERYSGLKKITDFKEISREYGKYKDLSDFNDKLLKDAEKTIQGYRNTGRRTKAEWLDIAKNIGSNYKGNSEGLTKYAIQSWFEAQPNQKDTLNRQGDKYVDFKIQEWVNAVYDGARIGELEKPLVPTAQQPKKETTSIPMVKNNEALRVESQRIANEINKNETFKQKGWLRTAMGSDVLKDSGLIKDLDPSQLNYVVESNKSSVDKANNTINTLGYEKSLDKVKQIINDDKLPSASDVALMQRMIQEAAKRGDAATVQDLIMDTAIVGTDLGQATQALSIIQRLTPEGQLKLYTKLVQRAKIRGEKSFRNVEITPEMVENVLGAYNSDGTYDQNDLNARVEQFKQDLANQMKSTVGDKTNAWRYLAMLGNPKTHIRNIVSNLAMNGTIKVKNAMARTLETILPVKERTKTWKPASQDVKEFARQTTANMKDIITGEAKYNEKSAIESKKQIFKNKALEKLSNFNGNALEAEDWFFSSRAFQSTLQEYLTANGINTYEDIQNNPEIVEKAKNYAKDQAEIATFRQYSKLAATINQIEKKNKGAKLAVQALMPFKKTPINVAKAGVKYSPLGLIKSMSYDAYQLKQGNINASQFIDNLSQGLTGTSLTLLGYALAKAGILSGSGGDDKDDKYDSQLGNTGYSLNIGGNSYSISWLSPVAMPLLVGSNAYEQLEEDKDWDANVVSDTLAKTLDPLNEMSFMQGLTNALQSYGSGTDKIKGSLESTVQNYVGQFFPTVFSQLASTLDDKKRSTKASNDSKYKFGEQTVRSIMYKIPGLRQKLEVATDIWGNEKEQSDNIIERAFESFIAPYTKTKQIETNLDRELKQLYNETGETGVIPSIPYAYVKYKDETYRMSANEYTQYKKTYGQIANKLLNRTISSSNYKTLSEDEKTKVVKNILGYSKYVANKEYFDNTDIDYENKEYTKADIYSKIGNISDFYLSKAREFKADKDAQGNTISGSAKKKIVNYINSLNTNIPEKAILIKLYGNYTFNDYDNQIINYVNNKALSKQDKEEILKQLGFTIRDGRVYK